MFLTLAHFFVIYDTMSKTEQFISLGQELDVYRKMMGQAIDVILAKEVSNYPIMVAHQQELELGMCLYDHSKGDLKWSIHASTLEEFYNRQIFFDEKIEEFKKNYKDPKEFICVFVLSELGANIIYLPRKEEA